MRTIVCAVALATFALAGRGAYADHLGAHPNQQHDVISWTEHDSSVQVAASATAFDLEGQSGSFWTVSAGAELWLHHWELRLEVPVHTLEVDDQRDTGIGDIVAGGSRRFARGSWTADLGGDLYAPTGDMDTGLGQGAAIAPRAHLAYVLPRSLRAFGDTTLVIGLQDVPHDTTVVEPRGDLELRTSGGLAWSRSRFALAVAASVSNVLVADHGAGHAFVNATPAAGFSVADGLWLTAFAEIPLQHERRFDWRLGLAAKYQWGAFGHHGGESHHHHQHDTDLHEH